MNLHTVILGLMLLSQPAAQPGTQPASSAVNSKTPGEQGASKPSCDAWLNRLVGLFGGQCSQSWIASQRGSASGRPEVTKGARIMRLALKGKVREQLLWECGGCWSVARLQGERLAVLKQDGIWSVPSSSNPGEPAKRVVPDDALLAILGELPAQPGKLLVTRAEGEKYRVMIADLASGALSDPDDGPLEVLAKVRSRDQLDARQGWLEVTGSTPHSLLIRSLEGKREARLVPGLPKDGASRFDPIWSSDGKAVIYVSQP